MIIRNTVILVDQIEHDVAAGSTRRAAIIEATVRRARPVVLTALAAVLAMIPLSHSGFWGSMAVAIMGGLLVATVLTILFLPALYALAFSRSLDASTTAAPLGEVPAQSPPMPETEGNAPAEKTLPAALRRWLKKPQPVEEQV